MVIFPHDKGAILVRAVVVFLAVMDACTTAGAFADNGLFLLEQVGLVAGKERVSFYKDTHHFFNTLKGIGISLGISTNLEAVTAQYVDVRLERKKTVLETYHKALQPKKAEPQKEASEKKPPTKSKRKSSEMEL